MEKPVRELQSAYQDEKRGKMPLVVSVVAAHARKRGQKAHRMHQYGETDCDFILTEKPVAARYVHKNGGNIMAWQPFLTVIVNPRPVAVVNPSRARAKLRLVVSGAFTVSANRKTRR
ncbi:hypothetical protein [Atlantibacter sp.]|uniref:hypothetical protein n=1 Tax=Atlantibacter sp. TaxID=1903473 RepID=UPI00289FFD09|nr:hypothetical protein [Atlantibacter sp.]